MAVSIAHHFHSEIIQILVGKSKKPYSVHRDLICLACPFFAKCLDTNHEFIEATIKTIELPEDSPAAFEAVMNWIYTKRVTAAFDQVQVTALAHAYVLADKWCMEACCNALVDQIHHYAQISWFPTGILMSVAGDPLPDSPLRDLIISEIAWDRLKYGEYGENGIHRKAFRNMTKCDPSGTLAVIDKMAEYHQQKPAPIISPASSKLSHAWHRHTESSGCKEA